MQTPASLGRVQKLTDITDRLNADSTVGTDTMIAARLRSVLTSTASTDPQAHLWSNTGALNCSNITSPGSAACTFGQVSLGNMSQVEDPFLAQLPAGYSTGIVSQFLPRINSSVTRDRISELDFPANCETSDGSFYANYSTSVLTGWENGTRVGLDWSLIACMPSNQKVSPWTYSRQRQDFTESLYLNLSAWNSPTTDSEAPDQWSGYFRITVNTTAGYFELPNLMNGELPGPLLDDDPNNHCGRDCIAQGGMHGDI